MFFENVYANINGIYLMFVIFVLYYYYFVLFLFWEQIIIVQSLLVFWKNSFFESKIDNYIKKKRKSRTQSSFSTSLSIKLIYCTISLPHFRYIAVTDPLHYTCRMTKRKVALMLGVAWGSSALLSHIPIHLGWWVVGGIECDERDGEWWKRMMGICQI